MQVTTTKHVRSVHIFNNKDYSTKLLGLQGVIIENIEEKNGTIEVAVSLERKMHRCPKCGAETNRIHDYRKQNNPFRLILN